MRQFTLRQGDAGQEVRRLQSVLGNVPVTGNFGPQTDAAVKADQTAHGLGPDGVVGADTYAALGLPQPLIGIDVSKWQGSIDWAAVAAALVRFAYVRASQGGGYTDPLEAVDVAGASAAGLPVGLYHFGTCEHGADVEASHFADVVQATPGATLRPMLDLEVDGGLSAQALAAWADLWIDTVLARGLQMPLIYTNLTILAKLKAGGFVPRPGCGLWIARYSGQVDDPDVSPFPWPAWLLWQWSAKGDVPGITGDVDLDWLAGGEAALALLAAVN